MLELIISLEIPHRSNLSNTAIAIKCRSKVGKRAKKRTLWGLLG
jgi:hypothetical protein